MQANPSLDMCTALWWRRENPRIRKSVSDHLSQCTAIDPIRERDFREKGASLCQDRWHWRNASKTLRYHLHWQRLICARSPCIRVNLMDDAWHPIHDIGRFGLKLQFLDPASAPLRHNLPRVEFLRLSSSSILYRRCFTCRAITLLELLLSL